MKALLIVDIQNDFLPGGALPVPDGDKIIPVVNEILKHPFDLVIASKDWHPQDHGSFASTHNKEVGEVIDLFGLEQNLWPDHCVQDSFGSDFPPSLDITKIEKIIYKGTNENIDSYSAFYDNGHLKATELDDVLKSKNIKDLYVAGLATDYCVKDTIIDARQLGYNTFLIEDAIRGININPHDSHNAIQQMRAAGSHVIRSGDLL